MALAAAFEELTGRLRHLRECLDSVQVSLEDIPVPGATVLEEQLGNSTLELRGLLAETIVAAEEASRAAGQSLDVERALRALTKCQELFHQMARRFAAELVSYDRIGDLIGLGQERRGEWLGWVGSVKDAIEGCRYPMDQVGDALFQCWREIGERVGMNSVSVRTTNVGQHFASIRDLEREGIP
jgi:hypothetical protein